MSKISFMKNLPPIRPRSSNAQMPKCSEYIEILHVRYFKYVDVDYEVENDFYEIITHC